MSERENIGSLNGIHAELENVTVNLGAAMDRLDGKRGYAKALKKVNMARNKAADALFHLLDAIDLMEDRE